MDLQETLQRALHHLQTGAPARCIRLCNQMLAENPGLIQAMYLRGCAAFETGNVAQSVSDLDVVYSHHPEHLHAAYYLGRSLRVAGRAEEALSPLQAALDEEELAVPARYDLATCLAGLRRRAEAIDQYKAILEFEPGNAQVAANVASLLERENRLEEAEAWIGKALRIDPANETARMTRAVLDRRRGKFAEAVEGLRRLIPEISNPVNGSIAWNQLGQCLEGMEDWDAAFDAYTEANLILKEHQPESSPDPRAPHGMQTLARIHEWLKENPMAAWKEQVADDPGDIVFLVGFPRSGTTLLDRMLRAHPDIEVLEEKSLFSGLHQNWSEPGTLEALAEVNQEQIKDARNIYRREMERYRREPERSLVVDKLPLNLAYLFLIYRLFPKAPVIFLQRHPMDACISCYFQAFELQASMGYFLDIQQTAQYYDEVMQVAALSMDQVGNRLHKLRYEDLVAEPETQLTALLDFLGLPWQDSVLEYQRLGGSQTSDTPSYQQVSESLYTRSIGRWQHYSKQLESCLPILQPWLTRFGYEETN